LIIIKIIRPLVVSIFLCFYTSASHGCIYNVRDVGFVDLLSTPYRLYYFIQNDTRKELITSFEQTSYTLFMDSNIKVEIINCDQKKDHPAMEYFHFWDIQSYPAAIFVSPAGRSMILPVSTHNKIFEETVWSSLENTISSPKREEILEHIVKAYGVVLFIEGKEAEENKRVYRIVTGANKTIARNMGQLPKRIEEPPCLITIPQEAICQERILLWSLGLNEDETDEPVVALLYGRGRRIGPLLKGKKITRKTLSTILSVIGLSCECGLDKKWIMGSLLPLSWSRKMQSNVVKYLGFDAENPMVKREISSILSLSSSKPTMDREAINSIRDIFNDYSEQIVAYEVEQKPARVSPAQFRELVSQTASNPKSGVNLKITSAVMSLFVLSTLTGGLFILLRSHRRKS